MVELGGVGTFAGPVLGSAVIVFGSEFLRLAGTLRLSMLGLLICVTILFFPGGVMQLVEQVEGWLKERFQKTVSVKISCRLSSSEDYGLVMAASVVTTWPQFPVGFAESPPVHPKANRS